MSETALPESISKLTESLQVVELTWIGIPIQLPKFSVYAVVKDPVFDDVILRRGRMVGIVRLGRYTIPVLDPFQGDMNKAPKYMVVVSLMRNNHFGLFAYPADHVEEDVEIPINNKKVNLLVSEFL